MSVWVICDWAGNRCFGEVSFPSFEDAWCYLYARFESLPDADFEAEMGEYFVEEL